jgi:hypothetical protein
VFYLSACPCQPNRLEGQQHKGEWMPRHFLRRCVYLSVCLACAQQHKGEWMPRHFLRPLAKNFVGDTGLLDFILKVICGTTWRGYAMYRCGSSL